MSADRQLSPEAQRLLDARNEAVAELKAIDGQDRSITDPNVIRLSVARLFEQSVTMRMLAGESVASSELKNATDMVAAARDALPQQPLAVTLTIVKPTDATPDGSGIAGHKACRRCGWVPPEGDWVQRCYKCGLKPCGDFAKPWEPIDLNTGAPSPEQPDTQVISDVQAPAAEAPNNVVPLPPPPPRRNPGSIHDAVLNGVPARMRRNNYSSPLEEKPGWDAKHPLPETFWPVVG